MPLILPGNVGSATAGGFNVANSLRFNDGSSDSLTRTTETPTNADKFTFSAWVKMSAVGTDSTIISEYTDTNNRSEFGFISNGKLRWEFLLSGNNIATFETNRLFRDPSAWYHFVLAYDSTDGTAGDRFKLYVNGVRQTSFSSSTNPDQNQNSRWQTSGLTLNLGERGGGAQYFDGYMSEVVMIDGSALAPTSFGEFESDTGIWQPIDVSGLTFGDNGFYLQFKGSGTSANSSGLGADTSGNGNHFTVNNLTALAQATDTCTNNFCTLNPLSGNEMNFQNGNLVVAQASDDGGGSRTDDNARGTMGVNVGKWYWETKLTGATAPCVVGICFDELKMGDDLSGLTGVYAIQNASGTYAYRRENGTTSETAGFPNPVANNIMNVAFDADNAKLYLGINGTYYNKAGATGNPAGNSNETYSSIDTSFFWLPWIESRGDNQQALMNFGGGTSFSISSGNSDANGFGNFEYAVPSGFFALCTKNLAEHG